MSASFFHTILAADARTNPDDNRSGQFAAPGSQNPRWVDDQKKDSWVGVHVLAETAVMVAAQTIADTPMTGLTGDHPAKRHHLVVILDAVSEAIRELALDADHNSALTDEKWDAVMQKINDASVLPFPQSQSRRTTNLSIVT